MTCKYRDSEYYSMPPMGVAASTITLSGHLTASYLEKNNAV